MYSVIQVLPFLIDLSGSIHYGKWDIEIYYYYVTVSAFSSMNEFHICGCPNVKYIYIYNCNVFLVNCPFITFSLVSKKNFNWSIANLQCCVFHIQQSDSVLHIHILFFPYNLFHYDLFQDIESSSPNFIVGPCHLSILYVIVCIC